MEYFEIHPRLCYLITPYRERISLLENEGNPTVSDLVKILKNEHEKYIDHEGGETPEFQKLKNDLFSNGHLIWVPHYQTIPALNGLPRYMPMRDTLTVDREFTINSYLFHLGMKFTNMDEFMHVIVMRSKERVLYDEVYERIRPCDIRGY